MVHGNSNNQEKSPPDVYPLKSRLNISIKNTEPPGQRLRVFLRYETVKNKEGNDNAPLKSCLFANT